MNSFFARWTSILKNNSLLLVLSMLPIFSISNSAQAAKRIYASYSAFERSISVTALENYAKKGIIEDDLAVYMQYVKPEQLKQLQRVLLSPIKINQVAVSQFLYTPQGEFLLRRLEEVIKTESRQPKAGFHALRSSLILAASEPEGLTLLNVLHKYPSASLYIDLSRAMEIAAQLHQLVNDTQRAIAAIERKSNTEAATIQPPLNSQLPDLRLKGQFATEKQTLQLFDKARKRYLLTDIYLPKVRTPVSVIVISHGLGSDSSNYEYLATHLASYGFAAVVPNHPGSDSKQLRSLLSGRANEIVEASEFYNRPLDIKYILDTLTERNKSDSQFRDRLNLQQVGVFGQSFGGYTALALAGAKINAEQLKKDCQPKTLQQTWNVSLLLQCRALELLSDNKEYNLKDARVKAVIAVNPLTSSIFGKSGLSQIQTPVMIVASSDDTIAPALYEQILPFSWITNSQKYLAVLSGGTHFSIIGSAKDTSAQLALPSEVVGNDPSQARRYMNSLSLPFFETYVARKVQYASYLNAAYAQAISSKTFELSLIQSLNKSELAQAVEK